MYLNYCRGLRFEEEPDYYYLKWLFRKLFRSLGHRFDCIYDWTILKQKSEVGGGVVTATAATGATITQPTPNAQNFSQTAGK